MGTMSRIHGSAQQRPTTSRETFSAEAFTPHIAELAIDVPRRISEINELKLRSGRLAKLRTQLAAHGYGAALLSDPMNIRYATGSRNMMVWTMHAPGRYVFVPVDGPVVMFEYGTSKHLSEGIETIDELRVGVSNFYFITGPRATEKIELWSRDIIDLMRQYGGSDQRLAVDRCEPWAAKHLTDAGISLFDAQEPVEKARMIKLPEEIQCLQLAIDVCDVSVNRMRESIRPGITENQLWGVLHDNNIAHDGEWVECRLLASGQRTNPWFQESGNKVIEAGEIVAFDTDMVGPMGYLADISRTYVCPGKAPTANQRMLYDIAQEQLLTNIDLIKPGLSFKEFSQQCWPVPDKFLPNRYMMMVHGAGMVDESPTVAYAIDFDDWGYDGVFEQDMCVCVESYIGEVGGREGVKIEEQVLITKDGAVRMSNVPLVDALEI